MPRTAQFGSAPQSDGGEPPETDPIAEARRQVQHYRDLLRDDPQNRSYQSELARALTEQLAPRLWSAGRRDEAAVSAREGVALELQLAADTALPRADLLTQAVRAVEGAGYLPAAEAITATESAVSVLRKLHADNPVDTLASIYFAWSLTERLAQRLWYAGRQSDSVIPAREGVALELQLAADPAMPRTDALISAVRAIEGSGYLPAAEGITATESAVSVLRKLHADNSADTVTAIYFAWSLTERLAQRLWNAGRRAESVAPAREGVALELQLAGAPSMTRADVLTSAVRAIEGAGYLPAAEGITATESAVSALRKLHADDPADTVTAIYFAWSLTERLAQRLWSAGRRDESVAPAREGVALELQLAATPALPRTDALTLAVRAVEGAGYLPAAEDISARQSAASILRTLQGNNPEDRTIKSYLGWVLTDRLAPLLSSAGQKEAAATAAREGISIELQVATDPATPTGEVITQVFRVLYGTVFLPDDEASANARTAVDQAIRAAQAEPDNDVLRQQLQEALALLAQRLRTAGREEEAAEADLDVDRVRRYHALSLWGTDHRFPLRTPITTLTRYELDEQLFAVGSDGRVFTIMREHHWLDFTPIGSKTFPLRTPLAALTRDAGHMEVWGVADDGGVYGNAWGDGQWHDWIRVREQTFPVGTPLTALRRFVFMHLFGVDGAGAVFGITWNNGWEDAWHRIGTRTFPAGAPVSAVTQDVLANSYTYLFAVGTDGLVYAATQEEQWSDWTPVGARTFPPGTRVEALAIAPFFVALWAVADDGGVYTAGWAPSGQLPYDWARIGTRNFPARTRLFAAWDQTYTIVAAVDEHGAVFQATKFADKDQEDWTRIGPTEMALPEGTQIAGINRHSNLGMHNLLYPELFAVGTDRRIHTVAWDGHWLAWKCVPVTVVRFSEPIETGGLAALGGWAGVNLSTDGSVQWYGHAHNSSSVDGYDFGVIFLTRTTAGHAQTIAVSHNGSIGTGPVDHDWEELSQPNPLVLGNLAHFGTGQAAMILQYTSHIGDTLADLVSKVVKWVVGAAGGITVGAVLFVGVEVGSLVSTGSLVPGACVLEEVLWMAGPANTLFAIGAAAIVELGSYYRDLRQEEYDFAKTVFGDSLPPREMIRVTDVAGMNGREFTLPMWDGKISLNVGAAAHRDLRRLGEGRYNKRQGRNQLRGETFIHEMTHAWQIHHTSFDLALLGRALAARLEEATGGDPYDYGPAGLDYLAHSIEGQAQIVSDWYGNHASFAAGAETPTGLETQDAIEDPYFRYIAENIRVGKY